MPRKGPAPRRDLMPDPVYRSVVVTQLVNKVLLRGQRSTSEHIVYKALDEISRKTGGDPVTVLKRAKEAGILVVNIDNKLDADVLRQADLKAALRHRRGQLS